MRNKKETKITAALLPLALAAAVLLSSCADMQNETSPEPPAESEFHTDAGSEGETAVSEDPVEITGNTAPEPPVTDASGAVNENTSAASEGVAETDTEPLSDIYQTEGNIQPSEVRSSLFWRGTLEGDAERAAYDSLSRMVDEFASSADLTQPISYDGLSRVFGLFALDHPEFFWGSGGYTASGSPGSATSVTVSGGLSRERIYGMYSDIERAADAMLSSISDGASEFETERAIFDWLSENVRYDASAANAYSIYGALVDRRCVCEGFSEAFQYLCSKAGIEATSITGYANNGKTTDRHKWNAVRLDGRWYLADPTWAVGSESFRYMYLNESGYTAKSHYPDDALARFLPDFSSLDMSYLNYYRLDFGDGDFDEVFIRALGHFTEMIGDGAKSAVVLMRAENEEIAEKYIGIINDSRGDRIGRLLDEFNSTSEESCRIAGNAGTVYGSVIFFSIYRR